MDSGITDPHFLAVPHPGEGTLKILFDFLWEQQKIEKEGEGWELGLWITGEGVQSCSPYLAIRQAQMIGSRPFLAMYDSGAGGRFCLSSIDDRKAWVSFERGQFSEQE